MMYPRGDIVHQNLSTEYTDVPELLSTLTSNGFAGVVEISYGQSAGAFFVARGQVLNTFVESTPTGTTAFGEDAKAELLDTATREIGIVNVYRLTPGQVEEVVSRFCSEIVFKGLSTDFVKLDKFIQKLSVEGHTGFIEIFSKKNEIMGTLFLKGGELADLHLPSQSDEPPLSEPKAIPTFLEEVIRQGAVFDVYRSFVEAMPSAKGAPEDIPQMAPETKVEQNGETEPLIEQNREVFREDRETGDPLNEAQNLNDGANRKRALDALKDIIANTEKFVDGFSQKGIFLRAFKRALIEKSELYPYLDPFMDQFDYRQGELTLDEDIALEDFAAGISDCFNLTLSYLKKEFPRNMTISPNMKAELESKFRVYQDALNQSGVQLVPPLFFK